MVRVLIVFYSRWGNTAKLAEAVADGAREGGADVALRRVRETAPEEEMKGDGRWVRTYERLKEIPEVGLGDLEGIDALVLGTPTRFGNMAAQLKAFVDSWGGAWMKGTLIGKVGAVFCSTSSPHGGNEATLLSMMVPMFHHGMVMVGLPYSEERLFRAAAPYGATAVTGPKAEKPPTEDDLHLARALGRRVADVAGRLKG